jgi:hypothetical protein
MKKKNMSLRKLKEDFITLLVESDSNELAIDYILRVSRASDNKAIFGSLIDFASILKVDLTLSFTSIMLTDESLSQVLDYI